MTAIRPPIVSVITPTYRRADLLAETIENVCQQTYPYLEHVIVVDGHDVDSVHLAYKAGHDPKVRSMITTATLGRNWSTFLTDSYAAAPVMVGQLLARGEYQCIWADDERALDPDHIAGLVDLLESTGADFAYPRVEMYWRDRPERRWAIGTDPPQHGQITHWMYRASLLDKMRGPYRTHVGRANDWEFIERAIKHGATWAFLDRVTFEHRADA